MSEAKKKDWRKVKPYGRTYRKEALNLAEDTYGVKPCKTCGHAVPGNYCCWTCGDEDP